MRKKLICVVLIAACAALLLSGCSSPSDTTVYDDNTAGNMAFNIVGGGRIAMQGDTLYYYEPASVWNSGQGLYCSAQDGSGKRKLASGDIGSINAMGEEIYFVRMNSGLKSGTLCSVSATGGHEVKLADGCREALVVNTDAYYIGSGDRLFSMDTGSGEQKTLVDKPVLDYSVDGDLLYYRAADGIYSMKEGSAPTCVAQGSFDAFSEQGGKLYYSAYDAQAGTNAVTIQDIASGGQSRLSYAGSRVVLLSPYLNVLFLYTAGNTLVRVKPDGSDPVLYSSGQAVEPAFFDGRAFAWSARKPLALLDDNNVDFDTMDVSANADTITDSVAVRIASTDDLGAAIDKYGLYSVSGENLTDKYNYTFFQTKILILALVRVQPGSEVTATGLTYSGVKTMRSGDLMLNVSVDAPVAAAGDDAECSGNFLEVAKSDAACTDKVGIVVSNVSSVG